MENSKKEGRAKGHNPAEKVALYGILIALAFIFSYVEALIPLPVPVPGMKLGLANLVNVVGLYTVGAAGTIAVGLILELFFFTVDYARSENLQYEDDEYYYYVKAVPKISVSTPEKTVKRINERQETEIIDAEEVRKKARKRRDMKDVDKMLLTQSMEKDFGMKK